MLSSADGWARARFRRAGRTAGVILLLACATMAAGAMWLLVPLPSQPATIQWSQVRQTIDGFGASSADFLTALSPAQADFFFTNAGIDLSLLRTQIIPDLATCNADFQKGACSDSNGQILNGELATARLAAARGVTIFASPWSPPGSFKSNGSFRNGGFLLPSHYGDWAGEIAGYVSMMRNSGIPVYAVSVQNEPDLTTGYGSCRYTPQQMHDFVPYLHRALQTSGDGSTKIMIAEQSIWSFDLTSAAMADPRVAPDVGILAAHGYHGAIRPYPAAGVPVWQTEDSSQSAQYDGGIQDAIGWAMKIHSYLSDANVNAWVWWFLTDMPHQGEGTDNAALTDIRGHIPKRAWITGQWSRFVRPGWSRVNVSYAGPLAISAFRDPTGRAYAIVVVNPHRRPVTESFILGAAAAGSITPWITSSRYSLTAQAAVPAAGDTFSYTIPGMSVVTLTGSSQVLQ